MQHILAQQLCNKHYTCPCCGYLAFYDSPGSYDICPICDWEDDAVQLRCDWWDLAGANLPLRECQAKWAKLMEAHPHCLSRGRIPVHEDERDPTWFPLPPFGNPLPEWLEIAVRSRINDGSIPVEGEDMYYWLWNRETC